MLDINDSEFHKLRQDGVIPISIKIDNWKDIFTKEIINMEAQKRIKLSELSYVDEYNDLKKIENKSIYIYKLIRDFVKISKKYRNYEFDTMYYVKDLPGSKHRNQEWHFDTLRSLKIMLHISVSESNATLFQLGSHKKILQKLNYWLSRLTHGRLFIKIKFSQQMDKIKIMNFDNRDGVMFDTDILHCGGAQVDKEREILIVTLRDKGLFF